MLSQPGVESFQGVTVHRHPYVFPWLGLSADDRQLMTTQVESIHRDFRNAVNAKRPQVPTDAMEGQTFYGAAALSTGLADDLVVSIDAAIGALVSR
jgi:ClpP class serine protease